MKDPFENIDIAMEPFWTDTIIATLKTGEAQTLAVSVFDDVEDEPMTDTMMDTDRRRILVMARDADWAFIQKMKRGDTLSYANETYCAIEVKNDPQIGIVIRARQM